jgi:hypothetical protein
VKGGSHEGVRSWSKRRDRQAVGADAGGPRTRGHGHVLKRGVRRGDLRRGLDLELALDVLGGAIFYRLLITGGPIDERLAEGVVELTLRGFAPNRTRARAGATPKKGTGA